MNAVCLRQKLPLVKGVNVDFVGRGLVATQKMSRKTNAYHGQSQPPGQQKKNDTDVYGVSGAPIEDTIQIIVFRVVKVIFIALEPQITPIYV